MKNMFRFSSFILFLFSSHPFLHLLILLHTSPSLSSFLYLPPFLSSYLSLNLPFYLSLSSLLFSFLLPSRGVPQGDVWSLSCFLLWEMLSGHGTPLEGSWGTGRTSRERVKVGINYSERQAREAEERHLLLFSGQTLQSGL